MGTGPDGPRHEWESRLGETHGGTVIEQRDGDTRRECLEPAMVASYLDGRLSASERESVELHLADCADCRELLTEAFALSSALDAEGITADELTEGAEEDADERPRGASDPLRLAAVAASPAAVGSGTRTLGFSRRLQVAGGGLLALAAAALFVIALDPAWLRDLRGGGASSAELRALVSAVGGNRLLEPRLSGGFAWGPPPAVLRSGNVDRSLPPDVLIAIAQIEKAADADRTPAHLHALGAAQLLGGDLDAAIVTLRRAADARPEQARVWNDLAAAYLTRASRRPVEGDLTNAIAAAERATATDASLAEAWFNLALARDAAGQTAQAQDAWRHAAALEPASSGWHDEAIRRMQATP
jgi:tetratricopeptide (TPR) repeat protein